MSPAPEAAVRDVLRALATAAHVADQHERGNAPRDSVSAEIVKAAEITLSHRATLSESADGRLCLDRAHEFLEGVVSSLGDIELRRQVDDMRRGGLA